MGHELVYGRSQQFKTVIERLDEYAASPWPVLLIGETGVGKELLARRIHDRSKRAKAPFFAVNCAAIPAGLFESELFGHEKGSFSGALQSARGLVRQARGGTLFLDEIGDLAPPQQVKLLRWLDSGEVRSVGSARTETVDVRIIAATNVNLYAAIRAEKFRHDLLERLSVLTLEIPPLRERREDIPLIAAHVLSDLGASWDPDIMPWLVRQDWSGNVRHLRNLLVRASLRGRGRITLPILDRLRREDEAWAVGGSEKDFLEGSLADIEKQVIVTRLKRCLGNRKRTAEGLGIAKSTLHEKLRRWDNEAENYWKDDSLTSQCALEH